MRKYFELLKYKCLIRINYHTIIILSESKSKQRASTSLRFMEFYHKVSCNSFKSTVESNFFEHF